MTGEPGRTTWVRTMPASASAFCSTSAPARVTGAIAPASVNGVMHTIWLRSAKAMTPCDIGVSRRSGELVLTTVNTDGSTSSVAVVDAPRDADHLEDVEVALAPERVAVDGLVHERQRVVRRVQVAHAVMDVDRLDRVAGQEVDAVERLARGAAGSGSPRGCRCAGHGPGRRRSAASPTVPNAIHDAAQPEVRAPGSGRGA